MKKYVAVALFMLVSSFPTAFAFADVPLTKGFSEVVKKVAPSVVFIQATGTSQSGRAPRGVPPGPGETPPLPESPDLPVPPSPRGGEGSAGSGVVIDNRGYIVTNNHVVEGAERLTVVLHDKREFSATVVGTDPKTDLAVIKIEAGVVLALSWGKYENIQVGDWVLAIGSPFGLNATVTLGIVSAKGRSSIGIADYEDFIQTDAAINPGNSGGALVNMNGELIGINTAIFSRTGGSEGIGFAVPVSIASDVAQDLIAHGEVIRGWLGVSIQEVTPALAKSFSIPLGQKGVLVSDVNESGPSAGVLRRGDVVLEYNGKPVATVAELRNAVARNKLGEKVSIMVLRAGTTMTVQVTIKARPSDGELVPQAAPALNQKADVPELTNALAGVQVHDLTLDVRQKLELPDTIMGVVVGDVKSGSAAEAAGLTRGDVVSEVSGQAVTNVAEYMVAARKIGEKESILLYMYRKGNGIYISVEP